MAICFVFKLLHLHPNYGLVFGTIVRAKAAFDFYDLFRLGKRQIRKSNISLTVLFARQLLPKGAYKRMSTNSAPPMVGERSGSSAYHTPRTSFHYPPDSPQSVLRAGVVVTSSRQSQRRSVRTPSTPCRAEYQRQSIVDHASLLENPAEFRFAIRAGNDKSLFIRHRSCLSAWFVLYYFRSSSSSAASAFAIATAGSSNPRDHPASSQQPWTAAERRQSCKRQESIVSTAATMRVLNVLRHWVSKHFQAGLARFWMGCCNV